MIIIILFACYRLFSENFVYGIITIVPLLILFKILSKLKRNYLIKNQKYLNKDKTILITGGCMGIGHEMIKKLINKYNCNVINIDIRDDLFEDLKNSIKNKQNIFNYKCDISNQTDLTNTFSKIIQKFPKINILINNAAIAKNDFFYNLTEDQISKTIEINLISPFILTKKFLNLFEKNKNVDEYHVVNIGSNLSHIASRKSSPYITSKWGLYGMHDSIKYGKFYSIFTYLFLDYFHQKNLNFTIVFPFAISTGMFPRFGNSIPL
jgi:short-subunit dehydrogenase